LGIGSPSGPSATVELLLIPLFLTTSVGGGIDDGAGVPLAAGVFEADSGGLSLAELATTGGGFDMVDEESLEGDSSLGGGTPNCRSLSEDSLMVMTFDSGDLRRAVDVLESLLGGAIVEGGKVWWWRSRRERRGGLGFALNEVRWEQDSVCVDN
jgi:hypothetical protein